ncbi:hypothetical protein ESP57_09150 [Agromyces fucosus]|uniref:Uncharacterized protein n=1 Tax=Agromyces fucosus TaxID=41985 RepID=A0A4V1QSP4_9MICO|nr:hypothetical protein [Agromyces fucosus]RXZ49103.1 hypothetical protein ESP57_09150 [Agromyces fucosus]
MSEGATTGIDPRFDPRYQRGYTGHAGSDAATRADAAAAPLPAVSRVPEPPESMRSLIAPSRDRGVDPAGALAERPVAGDDGPEAFAGWIADPEPSVQERADIAFVAAWVVAATALVAGVGLFWSGISTVSFYGPSTGSDQVLQTTAWLLAPSLVQAGLLGLVGMLVWTGVRHARGTARIFGAAATETGGRP